MAISTSLSPGMSGPEVKQLQQFLNSMGFTVATPGQPGSTGMETDFFGPSTQSALQRFQSAYGIVSGGDPNSTGYGTLGPNTLNAVNSIMSAGSHVPQYPSANAGTTVQTGPTYNQNTLQDRYGYEVNTAAENRAVGALDGMLNLLKSGAGGNTGISQTEFNRIINDSDLMANYVNALTYGGYTLQDVYKDMVRQNLSDTGHASQVAGVAPISPDQEAHLYKASPAYQAVQTNKALAVSPTIAGLDSSVMTLPVLQLPDKAFQQLQPLTDPNSPQFQDEMEKYKSATYETALEMAKATNETDHAKAQADWNTLKNEIQMRLGITLSNNAIQAWGQIHNFQQQAAQNGVAGSGLADQQIKDYLQDQMRSSNLARNYYQNAEDIQKQSYYQNYASPDEVKALIASDPAKAQAWGLIASDDVKNYLTLDNLKKQFPDMSDSQLQAIINKYVDSNGNLYSKLYGNYASNNYTLGQQERADEANKVITAAQNDQTQALKQYSDPNNPFLKPQGQMSTNQQPSNTQTSTTTPTPASSTTTTSTTGITPAAKNVASTVSNYTGSTTTPTQTTPAPAPAPIKVPTSLTNGGSTTPTSSSTTSPTSTSRFSNLSIGSGGQVLNNGYNTTPSNSSSQLTGTGSLGGTSNYYQSPNIGTQGINFSGIGSALGSAWNSTKNFFSGLKF